MRNRSSGFTILELLAVVVVIVVLSSITFVSYKGLRKSAVESSMKSDLITAVNSINDYLSKNGSYPTTQDCTSGYNPAPPKICLRYTTGNTINYIRTKVGAEYSYCAYETNDNLIYSVSKDDKAPAVGACLNQGLAFNIDASDAKSYSGGGTTWNDTVTGWKCYLTGVNYSADGGGSMQFDGIVGHHADCGYPVNNLGLGTKSFTISVWVKEVASTCTWPIFFQAGGGGTSKGFYLRIFLDAGTIGYVINDGTNKIFTEYESSMHVNKWQMYTVVFDRDLKVAQSYFNGTLVNGGATDLSSFGDMTPSSRFTVGDGNYDYPLNGNVSTVKIYNRALTSAEVAREYSNTRSRYGL